MSRYTVGHLIYISFNLISAKYTQIKPLRLKEVVCITSPISHSGLVLHQPKLPLTWELRKLNYLFPPNGIREERPSSAGKMPGPRWK